MRPPPSTSLDSVCHISYLSSEEAWSYFLTNVKPQLYLDSLAPALLNARRSNESLVPLHASPLFEYINLDQAEAGINKDPLKMHLEPLFHMNICVVEVPVSPASVHCCICTLGSRSLSECRETVVEILEAKVGFLGAGVNFRRNICRFFPRKAKDCIADQD